jgi:hypothetical protein
MSTNLRIDTSLADERLQILRARQAETQAKYIAEQARIEAEISALSSSVPTSSFQFHRSPIHKQQQRRSSHAIPRSMSSSGAMARHLSVGQILLVLFPDCYLISSRISLPNGREPSPSARHPRWPEAIHLHNGPAATSPSPRTAPW